MCQSVITINVKTNTERKNKKTKNPLCHPNGEGTRK